MNTTTVTKPQAQDYWHQIMTVEQRFEVMNAVRSPKRETELKFYRRCIDYVVVNFSESVAKNAAKNQAKLEAIING